MTTEIKKVPVGKRLDYGLYRETATGKKVQVIGSGFHSEERTPFDTPVALVFYRTADEDLSWEYRDAFEKEYIFDTSAPGGAPLAFSMPRYEHHTGRRYQGIARALHRSTGAADTLMVYRAEYYDSALGDRVWWGRPWDMFFSMVEVEGKAIPRFRQLPSIAEIRLGCVDAK